MAACYLQLYEEGKVEISTCNTDSKFEYKKNFNTHAYTVTRVPSL